MKLKHLKQILLPFLLVLSICLGSCSQIGNVRTDTDELSTAIEDVATQKRAMGSLPKESIANGATENIKNASPQNIPAFSGNPYVTINDNVPNFKESDVNSISFESYSDLDSLGRCGVAYANIGTDLMPTKERGSIRPIKPSGWHTVKYNCVDGKYLYNRCHLIGYQLSGENANEKNLITGTRYMNVEGMLPFENMVADYVKETDNHVLYRVTPLFEGENLVAKGVQMEAWSVEDKGEGICFHVFVYNNQPGIKINYTTGDSRLTDKITSDKAALAKNDHSALERNQTKETEYILNTNTHKFHILSCSGAKDIKKSNKKIFTGERSDLIRQGYSPCSKCKP